jgi:indolepyruvate ferredoxin oxidoreductase
MAVSGLANATGRRAPDMPKHTVSLDDKFSLDETHQLLTGTQAIVRLVLTQRARDVQAGLNTAGYVTGYRGSPIATLEAAFLRTKRILEPNQIKFMAGLNEDLAATALWGTQQAELRGEGKYDGVFGIWYGKGPGVDRTGDVFRHANHAGTSEHGGVLALMGDDHTCESSTSAHQSEFAFVDAMIPVLNPAGVQEILDYGLLGFALSRYAGVWVGLKCVKDNIEATATVDGRIDRVEVKIPEDFAMPPGGLNIRLGDQALAKEERLHDHKRAAILAFARANKFDRIITSGGANPKLGIITTGKSYLDVRQALEDLGIDEVKANKLGIRIYKVAMTWPLEPQGVLKFAKGLDVILVVEEKRALIETQVKEQLYDLPDRPHVFGKKDENEQWLFPAKYALDPTDIAIKLGERLMRAGAGDDIKVPVAELKRLKGNRPETAEAATRIPYFCPGCPHNTSTVVPQGSRAYAGIGCHFMAHWMDRNTEGFTQMGGEGSNWIGEAPFSKTKHVFQNLGDGTYIHSGSLVIRAARAAGVNMTFKILYNDAVAMTGGQTLDGGMTVPMILNQVLAEGIEKVVIVTDEPHKYPVGAIPVGVPVYHRGELQRLQKELRTVTGVSVLIYDQTCAAEKRRRRKRGLFPDPDKRVFINPAVCEGCGDCGVKSNCVAVSPLETELGTKRAIDQSACNKDFSCLNGFCPSFVTVNGAKVRKAKHTLGDSGLVHMLTNLPQPAMPSLERPFTMLVTGVGGTGVVTLSAVLGQAAHIEGKGFGAIDMTGLAQKGGAVACHMRVAERVDQIHAIRAGVAGADLVLGCDLVVTASNKVLETIKPDHTAVVYSNYEMTTADFTRRPDFKVPGAALRHAIEERAGKAAVHSFDAHTIAVKLFGDSIAANMFLLGYAYQLGHVPIGSQAIEEAIVLNGAAVEMSQNAFRFGRLAAHDQAAVDRILGPTATSAAKSQTLDDIIAHRAAILTDYQDGALAARYRAAVERMAAVERQAVPGRTALAEAVARGYFKLLAYKDEYEVARLYASPAFENALSQSFEARGKLQFHLAPPLLARRDKTTGEPRKMTFGPWMLPVFRLLAKGKRWRGTAWDVFGYSAERKLERRMITDYEALMDEIAQRLSPATHTTTVALAGLALDIKGYGHVKMANYTTAKAREAALLAALRNPTPHLLKAAE